MLFHLKPVNFFLWVLSFLMFGLACFSFSYKPTQVLKSSSLQALQLLNDDTVKYRGYRLDLTSFEVLKRTDDWVKIRCTIVNSGRVNVDFSKKGTEHWVQINFDQTLFDNKLGGLRQNIRQALYDDDFKLAVGQTLRGKELKVPVMVIEKPAQPAPIANGFETKVGTSAAVPENESPVVLAGKGGEEEPAAVEPIAPGITEDCPDIYFQRLRIVEQDDKSATIEYAIANKGHGVFKLFEKGSKYEEKLLIKAFISGVPTLSRGALPAGEQIVKPQPGHSGDLLPGDRYTGYIKIDVRKKTRYMKSLILSLDSDQFKLECDKTNNTDAVILD